MAPIETTKRYDETKVCAFPYPMMSVFKEIATSFQWMGVVSYQMNSCSPTVFRGRQLEKIGNLRRVIMHSFRQYCDTCINYSNVTMVMTPLRNLVITFPLLHFSRKLCVVRQGSFGSSFWFIYVLGAKIPILPYLYGGFWIQCILNFFAFKNSITKISKIALFYYLN